MTTGYTWDSFQAALVTQIPSLVTDPNFQTILPGCIDWAEQHISRDLDLVAQHGRLALGTLAAGANSLSLDTQIVVLEYVYTSLGMLTPISLPAFLAAYQAADFGPPVVWAPLPDTPIGSNTFAQSIFIGPPANTSYTILGHGTSRAPSLSATNTSTFISTQMPDLFWAAAMVFLAGYNQNYGAMADNTGQSINWAGEYDKIIKSAAVEEARKQFQSQGWTAQSPAVAATPPRK